MKKTLVALASLALIGTAFAGNDNSNGGCQGNCSGGTPTTVNANPSSSASAGAQAGAVGIGVGLGGSGGAGGQGGAGGNASSSSGVIGSGNSSVKNDNTNIGVNTQGQHQGQAQGQQQSASSNQSQSNTSSNSNGVSGNNVNGATGSGNSTNIKLGDVTYKEAAQAAPAYAPAIPSVPTSCWLYVSLGASGSSTSTTASASGGIPIGNVGICVAGAQVKFMAGINEQDKAAGRAPTFGPDDFLTSVCENVNGLDKMKGCQKPAPAAAGPVKKAEGSLSTDPLIAQRQLDSMMSK